MWDDTLRERRILDCTYLLNAVTTTSSLIHGDCSFFRSGVVTGGSFYRLTRFEAGSCESFSKRKMCIPKSVEVLGERCLSIRRPLELAFENDSSLNRFEGSAFEGSTLSAICIPSTVEEIGNGCFALCARLRIVHFQFPAHICRLGINVFYQSRLSTISIPASVATIGSDCFSHIQTLFEIHFEPNSGLTTIPSTMAVWTGLQTLRIPASVTLIKPLSGLGDLSSISFDDNSSFRVMDTLAAPA
jgi:hypothetical protein